MRGSCLCGQVGYEVDALCSRIQHCSCRTCRKAHAAAFNTAAQVKLEHFRWLRGEHLLESFESSPGKRRIFCRRCGSQLVAQVVDSEVWILRVATLDEDPGQVPALHIWASHEVPWLQHRAQVPVHPEWEPDADEPGG